MRGSFLAGLFITPPAWSSSQMLPTLIQSLIKVMNFCWWTANETIIDTLERQQRNPMTFIIRTPAASESRKPRSLDECLSTFEQWPEEAPVSANNLAAAGFYYLGDQLKVKCHACDLEIDTWQYGMTAMGMHRQLSYGCRFLSALDSCKSGDVQSVEEQWRLQTFDDFPFDSIDSFKNHSKEQIGKLCRELAACGFYRYRSTHNIRCAYCDVVVEPKFNCSIMFQHRVLAKRLPHRGSTIDCPMVRAQCPTNLVIPDRARYPEYPNYQAVSDRRKSFEDYQQRHSIDQQFISERANAGFFLESRTLLLQTRRYIVCLYSRHETYAMFSMW